MPARRSTPTIGRRSPRSDEACDVSAAESALALVAADTKSSLLGWGDRGEDVLAQLAHRLDRFGERPFRRRVVTGHHDEPLDPLERLVQLRAADRFQPPLE